MGPLRYLEKIPTKNLCFMHPKLNEMLKLTEKLNELFDRSLESFWVAF